VPLLLTQDDLQPLIQDPDTFEGAFKAIERAVLQHQRGEAGKVAFVQFPLAQPGRVMALYATAPANGASVRVFPEVGSASGAVDEHVMLLLDPNSGKLEAILAGDDLNPLRTAVPAGVGARYLAPEGARTLCVLGTGQQGRAHLRTICHAVASIERVLVWSPTAEHRRLFAQQMFAATGKQVAAVDSAREAVEQAEVVTATGFLKPGEKALEAEWLRPGALMITMTNAAPVELAARRFVASNTRPEVLAAPFRAGPPGGPPRQLGTAPATAAGAGAPAAGGAAGGGEQPLELADVIAGNMAARERAEDIVVFNLAAPYGWDSPIMRWAYDWARERGVGTELRLSSGKAGLFPGW
jgi:alanine dehydrogenase